MGNVQGFGNIIQYIFSVLPITYVKFTGKQITFLICRVYDCHSGCGFLFFVLTKTSTL